MVNIETYDGNDGQTRVKEDYPEREWVTINDNQRLSNIVLESAYLKRESKYGEVILMFAHDADTGELITFALGAQKVTQGKRAGKRGTVWSGTAIETLLNVDEDGMSNPTIKPIFINKRMWIGKTMVAGKSWRAFECDFIDGEPKFDSSYNGVDNSQTDDNNSSAEVNNGSTGVEPEIDFGDEVNMFILEELECGSDPITISRSIEDKFTYISQAEAVRSTMHIKKTLECLTWQK